MLPSDMEKLDVSKIPNILLREDGNPVARILMKDHSWIKSGRLAYVMLEKKEKIIRLIILNNLLT